MDDILEHFGFSLSKAFTQASETPQVKEPSPEDIAANKLFEIIERSASTISQEDRQAALDLVKQANLAAKSPGGDTLLGRAIYKQHNDIFLALLDQGADVHALGINKENAFGAAIIYGNNTCLDVLLDRYKVSPNLPVSYSTTLAELAAVYAHPSLGKILSLAAPQDIQFSGAALIRAASIHDPATLKTLMAYGIDMTKTDTDQRTVLHAVHAAELIPDLVQLGLNIESPNHLGKTPLALQVISGSIACVEALLAVGANPLAKDTQDKTPRDGLSSNAHKFLNPREYIRLENILISAENTWIENERTVAAAARKAAIEEMVGRASETQQSVPRLKKMQLSNRKPTS